jgi:GntR family transcriptional regulator
MRLPSVDLIDYQDSRPIYEQISEKFKILILKGILEPDEKMPSVRQLAMDLSTNPNTVQRAYSELERQGFLYSVKGKGNFVSPNPNLRDMKKQELLERLRALLKEAEDSGIPREELLSALSGKKV